MKLTDEQIEVAAKEGYSAADNQFQKSGIAHQYSMKQTPWNDLAEVTKDMWRVAVRYAAPFLQMPWDEPTTSEAYTIAVMNHAFSNYAVEDKTEPLRKFLAAFVGYRNAALIPKPVDPRREKIASVLSDISVGNSGSYVNGLIDRILAALDAKE